jgi:hypothetical protein
LSTPFHSKYWAAALTLRGPSGAIESLTRSIANSRVDLNPHQVDAALFAIRSPLTKGVLLADEVGLGKTVEAGKAEAVLQDAASYHRLLDIVARADVHEAIRQGLYDVAHGRTRPAREVFDELRLRHGIPR